MATLITLVDGDLATVAPVNANFTALNTAVASSIVCLYSSTTAIGNVLTGEDTLHTFSLPANTLAANGDGLLVRCAAVFAANANAKALKFYIGTGVFQLNQTTAAPNDKYLAADFWIQRISATIWQAYGNTIMGPVATPGLSPVLESGGLLGSAASMATSFANAQTVKFTGTATATDDVVLFSVSIFRFGAP